MLQADKITALYCRLYNAVNQARKSRNEKIYQLKICCKRHRSNKTDYCFQAGQQQNKDELLEIQKF